MCSVQSSMIQQFCFWASCQRIHYCTFQSGHFGLRSVSVWFEVSGFNPRMNSLVSAQSQPFVNGKVKVFANALKLKHRARKIFLCRWICNTLLFLPLILPKLVLGTWCVHELRHKALASLAFYPFPPGLVTPKGLCRCPIIVHQNQKKIYGYAGKNIWFVWSRWIKLSYKYKSEGSQKTEVDSSGRYMKYLPKPG